MCHREDHLSLVVRSIHKCEYHFNARMWNIFSTKALIRILDY